MYRLLLSLLVSVSMYGSTSKALLPKQNIVDLATRACCIVDDILVGVNECCSALADLSMIIQSEVNTVSSKVDVLNNCILGTQITQSMIPYTISVPGHYYLCSSVSSTGADAITINASDVCLNLNGFTVSSTDHRGITTAGGSYSNITIENGSVNTVSMRAMEISNIINVELRNLVLSSTNFFVCFVGSITNFIMEDCYVNAVGTGLHCVELDSITGGRLENVSVHNSTLHGFKITTTNPAIPLELINCTADMVLIGFELGSTGGITLRNCVASGSIRGFQVEGTHLLEDCIARDNIGVGFWVEGATDAILRRCVAESTTEGSGFQARVSTGLVCEGCISQNNNGNGFFLDPAEGVNVGCVFDHCLASDNAVHGFFFGDPSVDSMVAYSTAFQNGGSGIVNTPGSINIFVINCRSQNAATILNPAYNLNTNPDILFSAVVIIES